MPSQKKIRSVIIGSLLAANPTTPSHSPTILNSGHGSKGPAGNIRTAPELRSKERSIIPSFISPGSTHRPTVNGQIKVCLQRPNGSSQPAAARMQHLSMGQRARRQRHKKKAISGKAISRAKTTKPIIFFMPHGLPLFQQTDTDYMIYRVARRATFDDLPMGCRHGGDIGNTLFCYPLRAKRTFIWKGKSYTLQTGANNWTLWDKA